MIDTDVLVIGGGGAGMFAAIKAFDAGASVLLTSKGPIGRSGGSIFAGTLVANLKVPGEKPAAFTAWRAKLGYYIADADYYRRSGEYIQKELMPELEKTGLYIRRMPDGRILTCPENPKNTWTPKMGMSGRTIADLLRRQIFDRGIKLREEVMATSLLRNNGECVGATFLDYVNGEFFAVRAKTTILATGHGNFLSLRSTATRELCGDGISMAARTGAELYNLEIARWHVSDVAYPKAWMRLHVYPNPLPATRDSAQLVNSKGEVFWDLRTMSPDVNAPYHIQAKRLAEQVKKGLARFDGGYYSKLTHVDPKIMTEYMHHTSFHKKIGLDPSKDTIENAATYHYLHGGVWVNRQTMESRVRNLYAAGGAGGLVMGMTQACFDGKVAAENAVRRIREIDPPEVTQEQIEQEERRIFSLLKTEPKDGVRPIQVKNKIRDIMWNKMGYIKNEKSMRDALIDLAKVREELLPKMHLTSTTKRFNYDWVDSLDVFSMLDACELQIHASLFRKESRGPFYREDYPYVDNENWLKYIVMSRRDGEISIRTEPVNLAGIELPKKVDFFASDY